MSGEEEEEEEEEEAEEEEFICTLMEERPVCGGQRQRRLKVKGYGLWRGVCGNWRWKWPR